MSGSAATSDKLQALKNLADEILGGISSQVSTDLGGQGSGQAAALAKKRFDCGDYTCHGHFTCSSFGCGNGFKLADLKAVSV